jgi:hypothetical protein
LIEIRSKKRAKALPGSIHPALIYTFLISDLKVVAIKKVLDRKILRYNYSRSFNNPGLQASIRIYIVNAGL